MSDVQWLFLVLAALYGWECACWVRRGSVAFSTWLGGNWRVRHPGNLLGNQRGGFIFAAPLPPLGTLLTASQFPFSLSPDGVLAYVATSVNPGWRPAQSEKFFRFDEIREVSVRDKKLLVNGEDLLTLASVSLARRFAAELRRLAKAIPSQREAAIAELVHATLDTKAADQRWQELQPLARPVRLLGNVLFVYLFVFAPGLIWQLGFKLSWLGLLVGLFALTIATAMFFHRAHRALHPQAGDERFTHTLTILLAPMTTMRAHDALSRPLLETFHPLAVAKAFLSKTDFRDFARRVLLDLRHPAQPVCSSANAAARATELYARTTLQSAVENLLRQSGVEPEELCQPPAPMDESCRAYCPRCGAQFTTPSGNCADCGGLALVAFHKTG
ncbi:MAG: hypothetical protein MUF81_05955 [Verrucomicrobia bacterium]|jgi:hypothetical protein|nr:hypothetical protein [Verrucomicrobiota bacterium]